MLCQVWETRLSSPRTRMTPSWMRRRARSRTGRSPARSGSATACPPWVEASRSPGEEEPVQCCVVCTNLRFNCFLSGSEDSGSTSGSTAPTSGSLGGLHHSYETLSLNMSDCGLSQPHRPAPKPPGPGRTRTRELICYVVAS